MNDVCTGADLVLAMRPPDVVVAGKAPVVAVRRIPALGVADIVKLRNREKRKAAASQVRRVVSSGQPENIETNVRAHVRRLAVLAHASEAYVAVQDQAWRKD